MNDAPSRPHPKHTSPRKAAANRRNAAKSTGPRTAKGKSRSRLNALKHGILASQAVIATIEGRGDRMLFEATVAGLAQDFQPVGTYEQILVQEIAACCWRKRRLLMFENRAAFDAIEIPASQVVNDPCLKPIPWREPLYTQDGRLTTAEKVYQDAGLDGITLPNEADTMRIIRYEAAINRTRERAVASLREMKQARRGSSEPRANPAPLVDRAAAQRNTQGEQAKMLPPTFSARVWKNFSDVYAEAESASDGAYEEMLREARGALKGGAPETDQTKPKTIDVAELKRTLYRAIVGREMPAEDAAEPADDADKPPAT